MNLYQRSLSALLALVLGTALVPVTIRAQDATSATDTSAVPTPQSAGQSSYLKFRKQVYDIVILGDVLGTGLWAGMNRIVEEEDRITVTGRIQESSSLARPKLYNWPDATTKLLDSRSFDIAAVMLGANDFRDIQDGDNPIKFGSDEWKTAYTAQIKTLLDTLKSRGVAVYWFGVPPMGRPEYDQAMQFVGDIERQVMADEGVRFIDLRLLLSSPDGTYTDSGDDGSGETVRLRSRDGVKFITRGNDRLAAELMKLVRADISVADGAPVDRAITEPLVRAIPLTPEQLAALPSFAAQRADGLDVNPLDPSSLPGPDYVEIARIASGDDKSKVSGEEQLNALARNTPPDSAARRLFLEGIWPDAPSQRYDAFKPIPANE